MKANEAPEKIYLDEDESWHLTNPNGNSTEYTRTDAFIERTIKYIANHFLAPGMDSEIKDFVKYMKGE